MFPAGFETTFPTSDRQQTLVLDLLAAGIGYQILLHQPTKRTTWMEVIRKMHEK
jgi:hypothetical protein